MIRHLACLFATLVVCGDSLADYKFQEIHFPGALNTVVTGVDGGTVVGHFWNDQPEITSSRGFIYDGTTYTTVHFPGALTTTVRGIDGGKVVGSYLAGGPYKFRGFAYDNGTFSVIEPPTTGNYVNGSTTLGIDGDHYVGQYIDSGGESHGYLYDGASFSDFDYPGGAVNAAAAIDGAMVVGSFANVRGSGERRGYLYNGSSFQVLAPQGSSASWGTGIDDGRVVGIYHTSDSSAGFLFEGGKYRDIVVPASMGHTTRAWGIDGITVVGSYLNNGFSRGFITVVPEPTSLTLAAMLAGCGMMGRRCNH